MPHRTGRVRAILSLVEFVTLVFLEGVVVEFFGGHQDLGRAHRYRSCEKIGSMAALDKPHADAWG